MAWHTVVKLCLTVVVCFAIIDFVTAQGNIAIKRVGNALIFNTISQDVAVAVVAALA